MSKQYSQQINDLISQMTLDEKVAQMGSYWIWDLQSEGKLDSERLQEKLQHGIGQITRVGGASILNPTQVAETGNQIQRFLLEKTRLKIPAILHEESCTGLMIMGGTMYPQVIGLAASFEPRLAQEMTEAIRKQMLAIGARHSLAPDLDLGRDPRWGRIEETFGEDPLMVSHFGVSYIKGLQGGDLSEGVMATGKHFIGHSLSDGGLNCAPVQLGSNAMYDLLLAPFQAAIHDAGLAAVMNSYPEIDGQVVAASRKILTELLRDELGFEGLIVSDYDAISMLHNYHFVAESREKAAALALNAGIDVEWPAVDCYGDPLKAALEAGDVTLEMLETSVARHLLKKFELGLMDNPYVDEKGISEIFETQENRNLARKIAQKSIVLLKNDGVLPLESSPAKVAVIGPSADSRRNLLGDYSHHAKIELVNYQGHENSSLYKPDQAVLNAEQIRIVTILEGIRSKLGEKAEISYAKGCEINSADESGIEEAVNVANAADVVILSLGDKSGLVQEATSGETRDSVDLKLTGVQEKLAEAILATGKPVILVLTTGRPYSITSLAEKANAVIQAWLPGEEGGNAIADVLFGDVNPAGRLPVTFPRSVGQIPLNYNHKPSGSRSNWYVDYVTESITPLFAFGYGLSYTTFEYANLALSAKSVSKDGSISISFDLTNTGDRYGEEVVQLYIRDEFASVPRPVKELKGYARVGLEPKQQKRITFELPANLLAYYDSDLDLVLEAGTIQLMIGAASDAIHLNGEFEISGPPKVPVECRIFDCPVKVEA